MRSKGMLTMGTAFPRVPSRNDHCKGFQIYMLDTAQNFRGGINLDGANVRCRTKAEIIGDLTDDCINVQIQTNDTSWPTVMTWHTARVMTWHTASCDVISERRVVETVYIRLIIGVKTCKSHGRFKEKFTANSRAHGVQKHRTETRISDSHPVSIYWLEN